MASPYIYVSSVLFCLDFIVSVRIFHSLPICLVGVCWFCVGIFLSLKMM